VEKRHYPRQICTDETGLHVSILLSGGSLIDQQSQHLVQLEGTALDVSCGGVCLSFEFDPDLASLEPDSSVDLVLQHEECQQRLKAKIVHVHEGHKTIGLQFDDPLSDLGQLGFH
jgi:hypothetical protein